MDIRRRKSPFVYGPAGDLNYQQLLELQYLEHKPIIKQPISEYKAPRLLKVMCRKNGHRNADGKCLCEPEKVVPYIREKLDLPPLQSQEDQKEKDVSEPKSVSTTDSFIRESLDSEISDGDMKYCEVNAETPANKSKSTGEIFRLILAQSDDESLSYESTDSETDDIAETQHVQNEDTMEIIDLDDMNFYYSPSEDARQKENAKSVVPKLNLLGLDEEDSPKVPNLKNAYNENTNEKPTLGKPDLDLESESVQNFEFDEDGNKIWDYGPDDSDSEISEETAKRIEYQTRQKGIVFVNGIEIPPLDLEFLDPVVVKQPEKENKIKSVELDTKKILVSDNHDVVEEPEYEDDFESCSSEDESHHDNMGESSFHCNKKEAEDEANHGPGLESFRSGTESELRKSFYNYSQHLYIYNNFALFAFL